jgi:group I intron endonuclease
MPCEVYKITCRLEDKVYIGVTSQGVQRRFKQHMTDAFRNRNTAIGDAVRLHGIQNFNVETLWAGDSREEAYVAEIRFISELNCLVPNGYNISAGGRGGKRAYVKKTVKKSLKGVPRSQETRDKIRLAKLGKPCSEETKLKLRAANLGKTVPEEVREKMRVASSKRKHSAETRAKMSKAQRGRTFSSESIEKMRLAQVGRKIPKERQARKRGTILVKWMAAIYRRNIARGYYDVG